MKDLNERNITYMRLSVTDLCNLRCRYCMPEVGVCKKSHRDMLSEDEMVMAAEVAAELGINKIRITGGDPLVKKNILSICDRISSVDGIEMLCMTTNGLLLPRLGKDLKQAGVEYLNISLDTLNPDKYRYITRSGSLNDAMEGINRALSLGFKSLKLNTVLIGGFNDDEIDDFAKLTEKYPLDVRFIELMPMPGICEFGPASYIPCSRVLDRIPEAVPIEHCKGTVAKEFKLPGALGKIGLINPVSDHFCSECNRIRLTADGKLKPCLHSSQEISIKGLAKAEMLDAMKQAILDKPSCHPPLSFDKSSKAGRSMNEIGG